MARDLSNGDSYIGQWSAGLPHGQGCYKWADGTVYDGEWEKGQKHGRGLFQWISGARYKGEWVEGQMHVSHELQGQADTTDSWHYYSAREGTAPRSLFFNRRLRFFFTRECLIASTRICASSALVSSVIHPSKSRFSARILPFQSAQYFHDVAGVCLFLSLPHSLQGVGSYWGSDGSFYTGNWANGLKHGLGRKLYPNGDSYEGFWAHGSAEGTGRYKWTNGNEYNGDWKAGRMHGYGVFTWASGGRYVGEWAEGFESGSGVFTWADGSAYEGTWNRGLKDGKGVFYPPGMRKQQGDGEGSRGMSVEGERRGTMAQGGKMSIATEDEELGSGRRGGGLVQLASPSFGRWAEEGEAEGQEDEKGHREGGRDGSGATVNVEGNQSSPKGMSATRGTAPESSARVDLGFGQERGNAEGFRSVSCGSVEAGNVSFRSGASESSSASAVRSVSASSALLHAREGAGDRAQRIFSPRCDEEDSDYGDDLDDTDDADVDRIDGGSEASVANKDGVRLASISREGEGTSQREEGGGMGAGEGTSGGNSSAPSVLPSRRSKRFGAFSSFHRIASLGLRKSSIPSLTPSTSSSAISQSTGPTHSLQPGLVLKDEHATGCGSENNPSLRPGTAIGRKDSRGGGISSRVLRKVVSGGFADDSSRAQEGRSRALDRGGVGRRGERGSGVPLVGSHSESSGIVGGTGTSGSSTAGTDVSELPLDDRSALFSSPMSEEQLRRRSIQVQAQEQAQALTQAREEARQAGEGDERQSGAGRGREGGRGGGGRRGGASEGRFDPPTLQVAVDREGTRGTSMARGV